MAWFDVEKGCKMGGIMLSACISRILTPALFASICLGGVITSSHGLAQTEVRNYKVAQGDPNFSQPFPPWDLDFGTDGFSRDILRAVCDANGEMSCEIVVRAYGDCLFTDLSQPTTAGIGPILLQEEIVGCLSWPRTSSRVSRGLAFTHAYSGSNAPGASDSVILSRSPSAGEVDELAFVSGFAADASCANTVGYAYPDSLAVSGPQAAVDAVDADTDAILQDALLATGIDVPQDLFEIRGDPAGDPLRCLGDIAVMTYPPGDLEDTNSFVSDFNCGLSLIAEDGTYAQICSAYDGGDRGEPPFCFDAAEIEPPSRSCRKQRARGGGNARP